VRQLALCHRITPDSVWQGGNFYTGDRGCRHVNRLRCSGIPAHRRFARGIHCRIR
jgi:hypothetical protein